MIDKEYLDQVIDVRLLLGGTLHDLVLDILLLTLNINLLTEAFVAALEIVVLGEGFVKLIFKSFYLSLVCLHCTWSWTTVLEALLLYHKLFLSVSKLIFQDHKPPIDNGFIKI